MDQSNFGNEVFLCFELTSFKGVNIQMKIDLFINFRERKTEEHGSDFWGLSPLSMTTDTSRSIEVIQGMAHIGTED